jgi:hypothetical protein
MAAAAADRLALAATSASRADCLTALLAVARAVLVAALAAATRVKASFSATFAAATFFDASSFAVRACALLAAFSIASAFALAFAAVASAPSRLCRSSSETAVARNESVRVGGSSSRARPGRGPRHSRSWTASFKHTSS